MQRLTSAVLGGVLAGSSSVFAAAITGAAPAGGQVTVSFSDMVIFGDSLSDVGNMYQATNNPPSPPYYPGRASNGPVWVEYLAQTLGLPAPTHSLAGGNDYAWFGAETGSGNSAGSNTPNVQTQVAGYLSGHTASANTLYVLWAGANNFSPTNTDYATYAGYLATAVGTLKTAGAREFLVLDLPPLGLTPQYNGNPLTAAGANLLSQGFNGSLATGLAGLDDASTNILFFDVYSAFDQIASNPSAYGFTNVTDAALTSTTPDQYGQYLFWDSFHPTTAGHQTLANAIPEPASLAVLAVPGLLLLRRGRASA